MPRSPPLEDEDEPGDPRCVTEVAAPLDRWSSIYADRDRRWFKSIEPVDGSVSEGAV